MSQIIYPYQQYRLPEPRCRLTIDGSELGDENRRVDFRSYVTGARKTAVVQIEAELEDGVGRRDAVRDIGVVAVVTCGPTDLRLAKPLQRSPADDHRYATALEVDPRDFRGTGELRVIVSGTVGALENRKLAETEPWAIVVDDEQSSVVHGTIPIKWIDFAQRPDLQEFVHEAFHLDMNGTVPLLLLNSNKGFEQLRQVLPRHGRPPGSLGAAYETVRTGIARAVWLTLIQTAIDGIVTEEGEDPRLPDTQWKAEVLRAVLPKACGVSIDEAVREAAVIRDDPQLAADLDGRIRLVIERDILRGGMAIRRAVQALNDLGKENQP